MECVDISPALAQDPFGGTALLKIMTQRAINGQYLYFVTTNTTYGGRLFNGPEKAASLGTVIVMMCEIYNFTLFGYCILPNHVHLLVRRNGETALSKLVNMIKGVYSHAQHQGRFWQPRFNFRIIDNNQRLQSTLNYIRFNYRKMELPNTYGRRPWVYINKKMDWNFLQKITRLETNGNEKPPSTRMVVYEDV